MSPPLLEWSCSGRALPGERVSGDRALVNVDGHAALCAVVDGLGHGEPAAAAAERAISSIGEAAAVEPTLVERCHSALERTRGVAMSLASFDSGAGLLTWLGIGNVEGRLVRAEPARADAVPLLLAPGIVGHVLPALRPTSVRVRRGDLLLIASDGIGPGFADVLRPAGSCDAIARRVVDRHARPSDDAIVLVARYLGGDE